MKYRMLLAASFACWCGATCFTSVAGAASTTFNCSYPVYSDKDGTHVSEEGFTLKYLIDHDNKKSYVIGELGAEEVFAVPGDGQISFIEITDSKNVMITTVDDALSSVHSRNSVILGKLVPSQYYGNCEVAE